MNLNLNTIIHGNCTEMLETLPPKSVDLIFADPPYNLQLNNNLYRPNQTKVDGVFDKWDKFDSLKAYDDFTHTWLSKCKRVLKDTGTIWVIGTYHNIYRVGAIMQDIGFWFLNDILWIKTNPMPNFKGTRFNNAHETLIWASKDKESKYTFHYKSLKTYNDDLQMRSDWYIPLCNGNERLKVNGVKAHSTQKPEELLLRIILSSTNVGDIVLDPFMGSGTTGAIAKRLGRQYIGIEKESTYIKIANERIEKTSPLWRELLSYKIEHKQPRIPFGSLVSAGMIKIGERLFNYNKKLFAIVLGNASIKSNDGEVGSIHNISAKLIQKQTSNGWKFWFVERKDKLILIDDLRQEYVRNFVTHLSKNTTEYKL